MIKKQRKTWLWLLLAAVLLIAGIGGSYAYYTSGTDVRNQVITKGSEVFLQEVFNKDDLWLPGETKEKKVHFGNQSKKDQVIRFRVTEAWYDNQGTPDHLAGDIEWFPPPAGTYTPEPAVINWTSEVTGGTTWVKHGDWYYYTKILKAADDDSTTYTSDVISSVTFSPAISNAGPGAIDDFSDKRYSLTVQMESLDVNTNMTAEAWNINFSESGDTLTWATLP